mgnify:CR=1 FL=1
MLGTKVLLITPILLQSAAVGLHCLVGTDEPSMSCRLGQIILGLGKIGYGGDSCEEQDGEGIRQFEERLLVVFAGFKWVFSAIEKRCSELGQMVSGVSMRCG